MYCFELSIEFKILDIKSKILWKVFRQVTAIHNQHATELFMIEIQKFCNAVQLIS
jgi:hypothetical protein